MTRAAPRGPAAATVLPGFLDAHVHLALIDPAPLTAGGIARVLDLGGWTPSGPESPGSRESGEPQEPQGSPSSPVPVEFDPRASRTRPQAANSAEGRAGLPEAVFAGQFLAAPGGYPSGRSWAPAGSIRFVARTTDAAVVVDAQLALGASVIKVTLNSAAGPVLSDGLLSAIVARAHEHEMPVAAHAEGAGQALRAFRGGVDALAHTPFTERLDDALLAAMAGRMTWISTLDIHGYGEPDDDFDRAVDNLRRFHRAGGQVLYGTDLGNGPLPVGLNRREIDALLAAGLTGDDVIRALTAEHLGRFRNVLRAPGRPGPERHGPAPADPGRLVTLLRGERPDDPAAFSAWLCTARAADAAEATEAHRSHRCHRARSGRE
ncbi:MULTISPECIES: amidohydrolase [unclassified Cryobacterium]|uniref:amidohydrolase family protein n=1 Tax=unclassified Cryobacterium TaxID=2649013 RepID=UPI001580B260|nr:MULTISPECIES: amidohydrolase [unclassified Cryobacterium]